MSREKKSMAFSLLILFLCLILALGILFLTWGLMPGNRKDTLPLGGQSASAGLEKGI